SAISSWSARMRPVDDPSCTLRAPPSSTGCSTRRTAVGRGGRGTGERAGDPHLPGARTHPVHARRRGGRPDAPSGRGPGPPARRRGAGTPPERVDIDQIRLVALLDDGSVPRALVEDAGGIGYVVRVGTPVGPRGGVVVAVESGRLRIREPDADDDIVLPLRTG